MNLKIKSLSKESILLYRDFIITTLNKLDIYHSVVYLPTNKKRITLLKSPHVNKTSKEQFQVTSYKMIFELNFRLNTRELKVLFRNKPKTVRMTWTT